MNLISLLIYFAIIGFIIWIILQIPMPQIFRNIILGIVSLCLLLFVLQTLGFHTGFPMLKLN